LFNHGLQRVQFPFQSLNLRVFFIQFLVQPLDGRQRHAALVHNRNMFVIVAVQSERGVKILGHRTDVFLVRRIVPVIPFRHRQRDDFGQNRPGIEYCEIVLGAPVAGQDNSLALNRAVVLDFKARVPALGPLNPLMMSPVPVLARTAVASLLPCTQ
jgi:hypothetical protein